MQSMVTMAAPNGTGGDATTSSAAVPSSSSSAATPTTTTTTTTTTTAALNVESRLMHAHNDLFQAQLRAMHWLVDEQKKVPHGYGVLERALAGANAAGMEDEDGANGSAGNLATAGGGGGGVGGSTVIGSRTGVSSHAGGGRGGAQGGGAAGKKRSNKWGTDGLPSITPLTGCTHGEVYCKNLCRSCYQRWRRATVRNGGVDTVDGRGYQESAPSPNLDDGGSEAGESFAMGDGGAGDDASMVDEEGVAYGRRGASKRRTPGPSTDPNRPGRASKKRQADLCVLCELRPILCRSLCNGCYQRWHKARKAAAERGEPEVPCPSLSILAKRKAEGLGGGGGGGGGSGDMGPESYEADAGAFSSNDPPSIHGMGMGGGEGDSSAMDEERAMEA